MQEVVKLDNFIIKKNIDEIDLSKTGKYTLKNKKKFGITSIKHNYSYEIHYNSNYIGGIEGYIEDNILYIKYLFIFEEYRRMKLGSKLIQIIESHAKFFKCNYIFLTLHENEFTDFYKKLGFMILFEINHRFIDLLSSFLYPLSSVDL